ncbi:MAG: cupredoxin domain-containing protein [Myxococcales bacterium]|nr:cupredoxin domain-containing protein [Myxococcota bacterium]MDW8283048.1 cupredoxin domain-containing protein [Myxococcales bacterium]
MNQHRRPKLWSLSPRQGEGGAIRTPLLLSILVGSLLGAAACTRRAEEPEPPPPAPDGAPRRVEVRVSNMGYTPARIVGRPGERLQLVFHYDQSAGECGREVLLPPTAAPRRLTLSAQRPSESTVTLPPSRGELTFTCGMNMLRGTLVVR